MSASAGSLGHQKKMVLDRQVKVHHPQTKDAPSHDGKIELVRTTVGTQEETETVGIRASGGAGSYVEVPFKDLFPALFELAAAVPGTVQELDKMWGEWKKQHPGT